MSSGSHGPIFTINSNKLQGGYMQAKIRKLERQFTADALQRQKSSSNIFKGIAIFVNGYTGKGESI